MTSGLRSAFVFGLRMLEGVDEATFLAETGFTIDQLAAVPLSRFRANGLLRRADGRWQLSRQGLLISDSLWPELLSG